MKGKNVYHVSGIHIRNTKIVDTLVSPIYINFSTDNDTTNLKEVNLVNQIRFYLNNIVNLSFHTTNVEI